MMKQVEAESISRKFWNIETHDYVDALVARKTLENHVKVEMIMMKHVEKQMRKTDDEDLRLLFKHVLDDERKHHKIMGTMLKRAFKMVSMP